MQTSRFIILFALLAAHVPATSSAQEAKWVYVPQQATHAQLKKGDVVLTGANGFIAPIMHALNHVFDHAVVAIDDNGHVRHVTVDEKQIEEKINEFFVWTNKKFKVHTKDGLIQLNSKRFNLPMRINPAKLANLEPGLTNYGTDVNKDGVVQDTDNNGDGFIDINERELEVYGADRCKREPSGEVICGKGQVPFARLTTRDESKRARLHAIADEMQKMRGYYILNSFMNMEQFEPTENDFDPEVDGNQISENGSMCSGGVWWADRRARTDGGEMNIGSVDQSILESAAFSLHENIYQKIRKLTIELIDNKVSKSEQRVMRKQNADLADWGKALNVIFPAGGIALFDTVSGITKYVVRSYRRQVKDYMLNDYNFPLQIANQFINAFLFNRFDDTSDYWRDHLDELHGNAAVAPDHLLMSMMPNPSGEFTGVQTKASSPYDLIVDFRTSGGYYTKMIQNAEDNPDYEIPVDPRTGEPAHILVYENQEQINVIPNGGDLTLPFELVPIPEDMGGVHSRIIDLSISNQALYTPLLLTGESPMSAIGDGEFSITRQPMLTSIGGGARTHATLEFAFDPEEPGTYATTATIPNNDSNQEDYWFRVNVEAINKAYFVDNPLYYNQCDDEEDFHKPLVGSQFRPFWEHGTHGGYTGYSFPERQFDTGLDVHCSGRTSGDISWARFFPLGNDEENAADKPDLSRGTIAFWAVSNGGWRGDGVNLHQSGLVEFHLTEDTYVTVLASNKQDPVITLNVDGRVVHSSGTSDAQHNYVLQWDFLDGFEDRTHVRLYHDGTLLAGAASELSPEDIRNSIQSFFLQAWTTKTGDERDTSRASVDNVIIWDHIVDAANIMAIDAPKTTLE